MLRAPFSRGVSAHARLCFPRNRYTGKATPPAPGSVTVKLPPQGSLTAPPLSMSSAPSFAFSMSARSGLPSSYGRSGVVGLLIADPCVDNGMGANIGFCSYSKKFQTAHWIPALLNAFMKDDGIHYWGTLGDNWYDAQASTRSEQNADAALRLLRVTSPLPFHR